MTKIKSSGVTDDIYLNVTRFLNLESTLLDRRLYSEWLNLCANDITYTVVVQVHKEAGQQSEELAIIDEDSEAFRARIQQIATPRLTHAENPPTFARRFFSGLRVDWHDGHETVIAQANILISRYRPNSVEGEFYVGERFDTLQRVGSEWCISRRFVRLDHAVLRGAVSIIF